MLEKSAPRGKKLGGGTKKVKGPGFNPAQPQFNPKLIPNL